MQRRRLQNRKNFYLCKACTSQCMVWGGLSEHSEMPSVRKRLRCLAPTRLKKLVSRDTHGVCMAQSHVAYFLFCFFFCKVKASWELGARASDRTFSYRFKLLRN